MANILQQIINWLRAGYPDGVPREDYVALYAVLSRRLTDDEIRLVADSLVQSSDGTIERGDIAEAVGALAKQKPNEADVARVASRLAAGGWPLAQLTDDE